LSISTFSLSKIVVRRSILLKARYFGADYLVRESAKRRYRESFIRARVGGLRGLCGHHSDRHAGTKPISNTKPVTDSVTISITNTEPVADSMIITEPVAAHIDEYRVHGCRSDERTNPHSKSIGLFRTVQRDDYRVGSTEFV
jgi:hypothetical protein